MAWWNFLGGAGKAISNVAGVFLPNAEARSRRDHERAIATSAQYAAEFRYVENRNAFDSLVDGINRLVRPTIVYGVIALFVFAYVDPIEFQIMMESIGAIPEPLWYIMGAIVGFYFGSRELHKHRDTKKGLAAGKAAFDERQRRIDELRHAKDTTVTEQTYQAAMADNSKPLTNAVILEWNRRNG